MHTSPSITSEIDLIAEKKKSGRWVAVIGVTLFTGPIWGFALTAYGMVRAFNALEEPSAEVISQNVGIALEATMIGILTGSVGALLIFLAFFGFKN